MFEILAETFGYVIIGGIVAFLVVKEVAAYRLPASHPLNARLNPPRRKASGDASGSSGRTGGDVSSGDWSSGFDGTE